MGCWNWCSWCWSWSWNWCSWCWSWCWPSWGPPGRTISGRVVFAVQWRPGPGPLLCFSSRSCCPSAQQTSQVGLRKLNLKCSMDLHCSQRKLCCSPIRPGPSYSSQSRVLGNGRHSFRSWLLIMDKHPLVSPQPWIIVFRQVFSEYT